MQNVLQKILILATVIFLAVAGILVFYKTVVADPYLPQVNGHEPHIEDLASSINDFSEQKSYAFNDTLYRCVIDKAALYLHEGFLNENETDQQMTALVQRYVPIFVGLCFKKFNGSWKESDLNAIQQRIKGLKSITIDNGKEKAVSGSLLTELNKIDSVIDRYWKARKTVGFSTFISVKDANPKIKEVDNYLKDPYLKNCQDLFAKLKAFKGNIGRSHREYVDRQVSRMNDYYKMDSWNSFNDLAIEINNKIDEYNNNRKEYGFNDDYDKTDYNHFFGEAKRFFNKITIRVVQPTEQSIQMKVGEIIQIKDNSVLASDYYIYSTSKNFVEEGKDQKGTPYIKARSKGIARVAGTFSSGRIIQYTISVQ